MEKLNLDKKIAIFGIRIALIALALNMIGFVAPISLNLIQKPIFKTIMEFTILFYGIFAASLFIYFAIKIKIPK